MSALPVQDIFEALQNAGVSITPTDNGGLLVAPASRLTPELRGLIRSSKPELLKYFSVFPANDPQPEPPTDPSAWRELAAAYHDHHVGCSTCIAAGRGAVYGDRCDVGALLWNCYQNI